MPNNSKIILSNSTFDGSTTTVAGEKFQADGYYGRADGFHTVQVSLNNFSGSVSVQGTLAVNPTESDWFNIVLTASSSVAGTVDTTGAISSGGTIALSTIDYTSSTINSTYNFSGNYVWVRAVISSWTGGSINSIMMNY
jgi:hypothetical protein